MPTDEMIIEATNKHNTVLPEIADKFIKLFKKYRNVLYVKGYVRALHNTKYKIEYNGEPFTIKPI